MKLVNSAKKAFYGNFYEKARSSIAFNSFYNFFDVVHADTPELLDESLRLRHQVFCIEKSGYEDPAAHPDGRELDQYDDHAAHALLVYRPMNKAIGTVRSIYPNPEDWENSFPMQRLNINPLLQQETFIKNGCELSRFCISSTFRREAKHDLEQRASSSIKHLHFLTPVMAKIAMKVAPLGLVRGMFEMAMKKNLLNCYALMEPSKLSSLVKAGLQHHILGRGVDYHGTRIPFMCNIKEVFDHAAKHNLDSWKVVSMYGVNHIRASNISIIRDHFMSSAQPREDRRKIEGTLNKRKNNLRLIFPPMQKEEGGIKIVRPS